MRVSLYAVLTISLVSWQILRQDNLYNDVCGLRERVVAAPRNSSYSQSHATHRNENTAPRNQDLEKTTTMNSKHDAS